MSRVDDPLIRYKDLPDSIRPSNRKRLNEAIAAGQFPAPVQIGVNRIGWDRSAIEQHIANLPPVPVREPRRHTSAAKEKMRRAWSEWRRGRPQRAAAGD